MDQFENGTHVRLRSRVHRTYLHADEDGRGVSLHPRRASLNAAWTVQVTQYDAVYLLLRSAAYGRYLAATAAPAPLGHRGFRCAQSDLQQWEVEATMWQAVRAGSGYDVLLRHVGGRYLRANGRYLQWNTGVTVDDFDNISNMMHWEVEPIPEREGMPDLPDPIPRPRVLATMLGHEEGWTREIRYVRANPDGFFSEDDWVAFRFRGRSVFHLRTELASRVGAVLIFFALTMCIRAGRYARLTPLVIDLPRSRERMDIVVVQSGTPAHAELQYPDVDAEHDVDGEAAE